MRPPGPRETLAGPDLGPTEPFPIRLSGPIIKGFGRGSRELGIPTANIPLEGLDVGGHSDLSSGVYYGWAGMDFDHDTRNKNDTVYPMVMSIGWNPFYKNTVRSVEVHIIHDFPQDFYGKHLNLLILGFIRPEYDYVSKESLIEDINTDIAVTKRSLERPAYANLKEEACLTDFPTTAGKPIDKPA